LVLLRQPVQVVLLVLGALLVLEVLEVLLILLVLEVLLILLDLLVRRFREHPAAQRDLAHPHRLSARLDPLGPLGRLGRLVLQSSQRAPSRLRAQLLSRSA
jgi:hypothetical protein